MNLSALVLVAAMRAPVAAEVAPPSNLYAQAVDAADPELAAVQRRLAAVKSLRATFTQTKRMKALARPLRSQGTILVADGLGVLWQVQEPVASSFMIAPGVMVQVDDRGRTRSLKPSRKPMLYRVMTAFVAVLRGDTTSIGREFQLYFHTTSEGWEIGLRPRQRLVKKAILDITLRGGETIEQIEIREPNGDSALIELTAVEQDPEISSDERRLFPG